MKPKVLFVDDEHAILNALRRIFRNAEFEAVYTASGEEAIKIVSDDNIDVIISDYRMPDMDGLTLLKSLRERFPDVIRIILTGYPDFDMLMNAINEVGIFRIVLKPWRGDELKLAIAQGIMHRRLVKENQELLQVISRQNTELKEYNKRLEEMVIQNTREWIELKEKLVHMDKLSILGYMISVLYHELRNPLTAILALSELMMKEIDKKSEIYKDLKEIEIAALRCKDIINTYLSFSCNAKNREKTMLSIKDVLVNATNMMRPLILKKNQKLELNINDIAPVKGNHNELMQVFMNLIRNSMEAMEESRRIKITAREEGQDVIIEIADEGAGIPDDLMSKIFTPFVTTKKDGTGLGLSIVSGIVRDHGGRIDVRSEKEKGTIFIVRLPKLDVENDRQSTGN